MWTTCWQRVQTGARAREGYGHALGHGETRQEVLGRSLSRTTGGFTFGVAEEDV